MKGRHEADPCAERQSHEQECGYDPRQPECHGNDPAGCHRRARQLHQRGNGEEEQCRKVGGWRIHCRVPGVAGYLACFEKVVCLVEPKPRGELFEVVHPQRQRQGQYSRQQDPRFERTQRHPQPAGRAKLLGKSDISVLQRGKGCQQDHNRRPEGVPGQCQAVGILQAESANGNEQESGADEYRPYAKLGLERQPGPPPSNAGRERLCRRVSVPLCVGQWGDVARPNAAARVVYGLRERSADDRQGHRSDGNGQRGDGPF